MTVGRRRVRVDRVGRRTGGPRHLRWAGSIPVLAAALLLSGCVVGVGGGGLPPAPAAGEPTAACGAGGRVVPLRVVQADGATLALVEVGLQGQGPFLFALDTGASSSVVDRQLGDRLGLPRSGRTRQVTGVIGEQSVPLARVESWRLGDVELGPVEAALVDLPSPQEGRGLQGLIGSDVLSRFGCVVVDYSGQQLELPAAGAGPPTGATPSAPAGAG